MADRYEFDALTPGGEKINGSFDGTSAEFESMVHQKKLTVLKVKTTKKSLRKGRFAAEDFVAMVEELYYLIKSGMAIDQALQLLITTVSKESQLRVLNTMLAELKGGALFSAALRKALDEEKVQVDTLSIGFIATAEEVGNLQDGLLQLFEYLSFQKKIRADVRQALSYPIFLLGMSIVVALLIFFLIIPRFSSIFSPEEFEALPAISYGVLALGRTLSAHSMEFFAAAGSLVAMVWYFAATRGIPWLKMMYAVPKLSKLVVDIQLSIVYRALSTMLVGGLELDRALKQLQKVQLLPSLQNLLRNTLTEIKRGQKLSAVFATSQLVPPSDIALLHVGESSASLHEVFRSLSERHSDAFSRDVKKLLGLLEPAVIVGLGVFIAVIVVAIMMAVMSITDIAG